ncbi:MAG: hypothetical protein LUH05_07635 [Candidatus Gastranaerophilales bacterium]|nr:hypothetical protein [Candidatus Gastranaerophilales bacterium]
MNIQKNNLNTQNVAFSGHKKVQDKKGFAKHNFYYLYDTNKYDCEVELYNIKKDDKCNFSIAEEDKPAVTLPMRDGGISVDMSDILEINSEDGFAYRFKLTDKNTKEETYAFDNGSVIGIFDNLDSTDNKYNVVLNNRAIINKNGPMELIMPDEYYPGIVNNGTKPFLDKTQRDEVVKSARTHANKLGGNFYGIIERLPEIEKEGITRIVGTPFTKDTISSHKYWTENAYQISPDFGSEEDYKIFQTKLFEHGINWVADAALVNEGFGGIHLSSLLRKGSNSYAKDMFRADEKISLGILPDKCDYTRMKIINAPFKIEDGEYKSSNSEYNPAKPTYIQFYDSRLASEEQINSDSPMRMTTYDKKNTENIYDITKHDDAVYPFALEVSPEELKRNVKRTASKNGGSVDLSNIETIKSVADFTNFNVVPKSESGGLEVWDGNVDIAKLNFYGTLKDNERFSRLPENERKAAIDDFERGTLAVRDYASNSGIYWTKLTDDTLFEHVSSSIGEGKAETSNEYMDLIKEMVSEHKLPSYTLSVIDKETVENVLKDDFSFKRLDSFDMRSYINPETEEIYEEGGFGNDYKVSDYVMKKSMDLPLETLPVNTNLLEIITSPYIAKRANTEEELGISRYDLTKADNPNLPEKYENVYSQVDELYENEIAPKILEILEKVPGISDETGNVTEYGKYVISETAPELTKYLLLKSLAPDADVSIQEDGHIDFSGVDSENITMQSLGIPYSGKTSEEEAQDVVSIMEKGISQLNEEEIDDLKNKMQKRFSNRTLNDFKMAEMIMDKTEAGLGWRIDAAKDIASIDPVRSDAEDMNNAWDNVTSFWKLFNQSVLEINPHVYTTAELTDLDQLFTNNPDNKYTNGADAERKFLQETGITSVANYNYFFSLLPDLYTTTYPSSGIDNPDCWMGKYSKNFKLREKLDTGWKGNPGFLFQSPEDGVTNSYTFIGNHDKPRVSHLLALDMGLFNSDFSSEEHQQIAANVTKKDIEDIDFDTLSSKAVAMGSRLNDALEDACNDEEKPMIVSDETKEQIKEAIADIVNSPNADAFGTRPFETAIESVFKQVEQNTGKEVPNKDEMEARILEKVLLPAFDRFYSMYKLLITLPGSPTDFAGDKTGVSGYETKAKNYHQQNRNVIHWEWLEEGKYGFIKTFYENMNKITNIRKPENAVTQKPSILNSNKGIRKDLSALNDGATVTIPVYTFKEGKDENGKKKIEPVNNEFIQAFLRYNDKGSVVLTLHDSSGSNTDFDKRMERGTSEIGEDKKQKTNSRLFLDIDYNSAKQGLKHGLPVGTKFKNEKDGDDSVYKIAKMQKDGKDYYYLKRENAQGQEINLSIEPDDFNTVILYKI